MGNKWINRSILLIVPILFYVGSMYCVDILVENKIIPGQIGNSPYNLFLIANCAIIEIFLLLVIFITNCHREIPKFSEFRDPVLVMITLGIIGKSDSLPDWIKYVYYCVPTAAIIYMIAGLNRYTTIPFVNTIWKLKGVNSIWIFNSNKTLNLCSSDGKTTFYKWDFNWQSLTLVIQNDNEKRVYLVKTSSDYNLILFRLSSGETLKFNKFSSLEPTKETTPAITDKG